MSAQNSGFKVLCILKVKEKEMKDINTLEEKTAEACEKGTNAGWSHLTSPLPGSH